MQRISITELYTKLRAADFKLSTDTRRMEAGAVFFALKGANFNANTFAAKAIEAGCSLAVVDEEQYTDGQTIVLVDNVQSCLQELANHHRAQFNIPVLAITGSNAKTTHKELIAAVLSTTFKTLATEGNLNNHIGVPLTLLRLRPEHEFAIIEMGANHQGEIAELSRIADPDYGLITNIGSAHLEGFGGIEGVKAGKSELYKYLRAKGAKCFINGDDEVLYGLAFDNDKITYGTRKLYDVIGKDCTDSHTVSFKYTTRYGEKDWAKQPIVRTQISGGYNFINCLAAVCVGHYFKVADSLIQQALESYVPSMNRSQLLKTAKNTVLLDAYNANPSSMRVAIDNFSRLPAEKKLVLLGDMFELGEYSGAEHRKLVDHLRVSGIAEALLVGEEFSKLGDTGYLTFKTTAECLAELRKRRPEGYTVLVKGSRGMKMETLQDAL